MDVEKEQSGWRLPSPLMRRIRVRAAELGVPQNVFVERALEKALGSESVTEVARVSRTEPTAPPRTHAKPLGKGYTPGRPKGGKT